MRDAFRQSPEIVVGRAAAACVHPLAAWQVLSASWRFLVLTVYTVTSFLTVLSVLVVLNP
jgi:hypothetical protein